MYWTSRNQNVFGAVNYEVNPKLTLFGNFVWNDGRGTLGGLQLDTNQVPKLPDGFNYAAVSEIGRFSALNAGRTQNAAGVNYLLRPDWQFSATYFYARYKDRDPYLMNMTGRTQGVEFGLNYMF
jgi:hypothetical protein